MKFVQALNLAIQGKRVRHDEQKGDWYLSSINQQLFLYYKGYLCKEFSVSTQDTLADWYEILVDTIASIKVGTTFTVVESDVSAVKVNVKYMKVDMTNMEYKDFVCFVNLSNGQFHAEPRDIANKVKVKIV